MDDGTYKVSPGPTLAEARSGHAATVAVGMPIVFGGYGADGVPLDTIEAVNVAYGTSQVIARMQTPPRRGDRVGAARRVDPARRRDWAGRRCRSPTPSCSTRSRVRPKGNLWLSPATRHSATVLADGRVLIAGGSKDEAPSSEQEVPSPDVELFVPRYDFVNERPLGTARADHLAVPLCDETVLLMGGGDGAEVYTGAPR